MDGSQAVRIDKMEEYSAIGLCPDVFKVIGFPSYPMAQHESGKPIHNVYIENTVNGNRYLHSKAFIEAVKPKEKQYCEYCGKKLY
jgi:uncharacterized Zn-finger protein